MALGDDGRILEEHTVTTDFKGYAVYTFKLPKEVQDDDGTVTAEAKRGPYRERIELNFDLYPKGKLTLATDKPIYQPGQVAHLRVLAFGPDQRALSNKDVVITIQDEDGNEQFHKTVKTSRFGVASADWDIPEKLSLGNYQVGAIWAGAQLGDDDPRGFAVVRVSRYQLPNFTVKADPDRTYYLPGQDATIRISADYLFGKAVQNARVRLVKQQDRHWDFKQQKWVADESTAIEGTFDKEGAFEAKVDLQNEFKDFAPEGYSHYEDLTFAAYVTDLSTKRTEQRRFRIRLSEKPIHVYVISDDTSSTPNERPSLYVTTSYADGIPAAVSGTVYFAEPDNSGKLQEAPWQGGRSKALTFHTNKFGVAKLMLPRIRDRFLSTPQSGYQYGYRHSTDDDSYRDALLLFEVTDKKGRQGRGSEAWTVAPEHSYLRVNTERVLYHPGDALPITIESNSSIRDVIVNVSTSAGLITSRVVQLQGGRADLSLDYDSRLSGEVQITAFAIADSPQNSNYALSDVSRVIYPAPQDLRVGVRMPRTTYRPGEIATADISVQGARGKPIESDLGVLVFDRAVAERVRSDEEFGRAYGFSITDYLDENFFGQIAGISYDDLLKLNPNQPFSADLQLVAEALLSSAQYNWWDGSVKIEGGENYSRDAKDTFAALMDNSLTPTGNALNALYSKEDRYPKNDVELKAVLAKHGIDLSKVMDPWGIPYRTVFFVDGTQDVLTFKSNGPDKKANTADDADAMSLQWQYFLRTGRIIDQIVAKYPYQTGNYIRDYPTLRRILKTKGLDPDAMLDPWGHHYRFSSETTGPYFRILVTSAGPDGIFDSAEKPSWDDVREWTSEVHYFQVETRALQLALAEHFAKTRHFPQTDDELKPILAAAHITGERLLDPWGRPYHFTFSRRSRYSNRVHVSTYYDYITASENRVTEVVPVTQEMGYINLSSYGPDNKPEHSFSVAEFSRVLTEQSSKDLQKKQPSTTQGPLPSGSGAITGVITDQSGAVISNATVTATSPTGISETVKTAANGRYLISSLSAGVYTIQFYASGFQQTTVTQVPVQPGSTTTLDATLHVGTVSEMVEVRSKPAQISTESMGVAGNAKELQGTPAVPKPLFTPRLRKYFPETLVWRPEVITDKRGRAHIAFPMADNITAWSMSIIASSEAGEVGVAQKELRTFQPFFVEHDPPKVLTEGDQISLPVVLRNYSDKQQTLLTEFETEPWFSMLSPSQQSVTVPVAGDASAVFTFKATASANPGTQRVTARNNETGDAVEREVLVHPDGQEISFTTGRILAGKNQTLDIQVPSTAIAGTVDAELRIYPNLIAHVLDAMDGIAKKPTGCAEQITSIGYINLEALQLLRKAGINGFNAEDPRTKVYAGALKSVQDAYELLPSLQKASGGFSYWNNTTEDVAVTAYVLRFLAEARNFIQIDPQIMSKARSFLISQQTQAGGWTRYDWSTKRQNEDPWSQRMWRALWRPPVLGSIPRNGPWLMHRSRERFPISMTGSANGAIHILWATTLLLRLP